jgi:transposase
MIIIGADYHPGFQQIAFVDTETGDCGEQRLQHREEAERFYRDLRRRDRKCVWGWRPVDMRAGLNDCWPS